MINLISAKFFRLSKIKGIKILFIVAFFCSLFTAFSCALIYGETPYFQNLLDNAIATFKQYTYLSDLYSELLSMLELLKQMACSDRFYYLALGFTSDSFIFLAVFIYLYAFQERKEGMFYSVYSFTDAKTRFLSDAIVIFVFSLALHLIMALAFVLMSFAAFRETGFIHLGDYLLYFFLKVLLLTLLGLLMIAFADFTGNKKNHFVFSILYVVFVYSFFYSFLDSIIQNLMNINLYGEYGFPMGSYLYLGMGDLNSIISSLIVLALYGALAAVVELIVCKKRDLI